MTNQNNNLMTVSEALAVLGISRATFDRWKKDKQLPYIKIGKEVFVNREKLQLWMDNFDHSEFRSVKKKSDTQYINIGYQTGSAQLWSSILIKKLNLFEEQLNLAMPEKQFEIVWHNANNGIELVQKFLSDELHLIAVGDFPIHISFNLARLFPNFNPLLIAFDGKSTKADGIALVLQPDIHTEQRPLDLATVSSTSSAYHLHQYMKMQKLPFHAVPKDSMEHCMNSFLQQEVDGAMLWEPYITIVEQLGVAKRLEMDEQSVYLTGILANQNHLRHPANQQIATAYLKALLQAHQLLHQVNQKAIQAIAEETGFDVNIIKSVISRIRYDAVVYHDDIKRINKIFTDSPSAQALINSDFHGLSHPKIHVNSTYLNEAIEQLGLPEIAKHRLAGQWMERCY